MADGTPAKMLLTRGEVAALAGVSVKTISRWQANGLLRRVIPTGVPRYARSDVERLLGGVIELSPPRTKSKVEKQK